MRKKILIIGNSANAYALAKKISEKHDVYTAPLSRLLGEFTTNLDIREDNISELLEFVMENQIYMTIPISEKAINANISAAFSKNNQLVFSPSAEAAELCNNRCLAKKIFYKLHIPTPKFGIFEKENLVYDYIKNQKLPFVIKTNDLNSSVVLTSEKSAKTIISSIFVEKNKKIIVEDYVYGSSFTYYAITDGYKALPIGSSLDYRHALDGEGGQLTNGMGSCSPNYKLSIDNDYFLMDNVIYPILEYLESTGKPYMGIIGVNGVKTSDGTIYILGVTNFFQDPETAAIIHNLDEDLISLFESCIVGSFSDEIDVIKTKNLYGVSLVLRCNNTSNKENTISGIENLDENTVLSFYNNVTKNNYLEYKVNKGSALVLTSFAPTVTSASNKVYEEQENINFIGKNYRNDICKAL